MTYREIPYLSEKDKARFWAKVDVRSPDECWLWLGARSGLGYGCFTIKHAAYTAHRIALAAAATEVPVNRGVMHGCDNPPCCNPAHLSLGTQAENMRDMRKKGRQNYVRGSSVGLAKLTESAVRDIRNSRTFKAVDLAETYGVTRSTIYNVWSRKTWS